MHAAAVQAQGRDRNQLFAVIRNAAAAAAEGIRRANHHRVTDALRHLQGAVQVLRDFTLRTGLVDALHRLFEELTVLRHADRIGAGADHRDIVLLQEAGFLQLHRQVQRVLAAQGRQDAVRLFFDNDLFDGLHGQRFDVHFIGDLLVRHDRRRVGVDQDDFHALFPDRTACLRARIVEFRRLADDNRAGADDDNLFDIWILAHIRLPPIRSINLSNRNPVSSGPEDASGWNCTVKTRPFL